MRRTVLTIAATLAVLLLLLSLVHMRWALFDGDEEIDAKQRRLMWQEGIETYESWDVPVSALLMYGDRVIGVGHNTVWRDTIAGGHAELNAISDALRRYGSKGFRALNRDSLRLLTTYEPCKMCSGGMLEYDIRHVEFLKGKGLTHWLREEYRTYRYLWLRTKRGPEELADSLFRLHPSDDSILKF